MNMIAHVGTHTNTREETLWRPDEGDPQCIEMVRPPDKFTFDSRARCEGGGCENRASMLTRMRISIPSVSVCSGTHPRITS